MKHEYDATPTPRGQANEVPTLPTLQGSIDADATYNEHPDNRHCPQCGHDKFTLSWRAAGESTLAGRTVNDARRAMEDAARPLGGG